MPSFFYTIPLHLFTCVHTLRHLFTYFRYVHTHSHVITYVPSRYLPAEILEDVDGGVFVRQAKCQAGMVILEHRPANRRTKLLTG